MWRVILGWDIEENLSCSKGVTMDDFSISVKGWWKMTISHLKHSYLNWRANLCRGFFFWIWLSWFSFGLNRIFQVHDMTINLSFFFLFFVLMISSTSGNVACRRWLSSLKHLSSCENCFEKGSFFGSKGCLRHLFKGKGMTQKCFICVSKEQGYGSKGCWYHLC